MDKIGALIVTFNPEVKRLEENIKAIKPQVDMLVVVDNGSTMMQGIEVLADKYELSLVKLGTNTGISGAQNSGMQYLKDGGMSWGITLDQDSVMPTDTVGKYVSSGLADDPQTGILAAQYDDPSWTNKQREDKLDNSSEKYCEKKMVIASGNMVRIEAWENVGGFDEWMFIDQVDFDFDAKLLLAGYKIWQVNDVIMQHAVGAVVQRPVLAKLLLFPNTAIFSDHSAFREYYIQRNTIVYAKRYPEFRRHRFQTLVSMVQSRRILVYTHPWRKIKAAWKGIIDGMKYNSEKDEEFADFRNKMEK